MSIDNFIPNLWSGQIQKKLRNELVFGGLVNRRYEGELKRKGDTVTIFTVGETTIKNMPTRDSKGAPRKIDDPEGIATGKISLVVDQEKYFNVGIDDVDAIQRNADLFPEYIDSAVYGLKSAMDKHIIDKMTKEAGSELGTEVSPVELTAENMYNEILKLKIALDRANAPQVGRFLVMPPEAEGILLSDNRFIYVGTGGNALANGRLFKASGFDIAISNDLTLDHEGKCKIIASNRESTAFVEQILHIEPYRVEKAFSDAVKGLAVYGCKVIRPEHVIKANVKIESSGIGVTSTKLQQTNGGGTGKSKI